MEAPLDDVWEFHSTIKGLKELTPGWMKLEVESVEGPDGEPNPEVLKTGSVIEMSIKPFGVLPRATWSSRIEERKKEGNQAWFRDEMVRGPFKRWIHTHSFERFDSRTETESTKIKDSVEYQLPLGLVGRAGSPLFQLQMRMMFRSRHKRTKELLE